MAAISTSIVQFAIRKRKKKGSEKIGKALKIAVPKMLKLEVQVIN